MTLAEGQFKLGDLVFGSGTPIRVSKFEPSGYDVNVRDRNVDNSDEVAFGLDSITPQPIAFEMAVIDNFNIQHGPNILVPGWSRGTSILEQLKGEWRADTVRKVWGSQKGLYYKKNGPEKVIFGRPRKFTEAKTRKGAEIIPVVAEFMPNDSFSYSSQVFASNAVAPAAEGTYPGHINRVGGGSGYSWVQIIITGPINNPKVVFDDLWEAELQINLAAGKTVEINSYPWLRRVIDSDSNYLSAKLIGDSEYLSDMKIPPFVVTDFGLSGSGTTGATSCTVNWRETYLSY